MKITVILFITVAVTHLPDCQSWSFKSFFSKIVGDSYDDCLSTSSSFTFNKKAYCDSGKQLIEECDFDENFECGDDDKDTFKMKRSIIKEGKELIKDYSGKFVEYAGNKTARIIEKTEDYGRRFMNKISKYRKLFLSSESFYEIGKAYEENCDSKLSEYFGTFKTGSKREYIIKIVCNKKGTVY